MGRGWGNIHLSFNSTWDFEGYWKPRCSQLHRELIECCLLWDWDIWIPVYLQVVYTLLGKGIGWPMRVRRYLSFMSYFLDSMDISIFHWPFTSVVELHCAGIHMVAALISTKQCSSYVECGIWKRTDYTTDKLCNQKKGKYFPTFFYCCRLDRQHQSYALILFSSSSSP